MKSVNINILFFSTLLVILSACSDDFLKPKPLSILTTEAGLVDATSMYATLGSSTRNIRNHYMDGTFAPSMFTEYLFTEVMIDGTTDKTFPTDIEQMVSRRSANDASYNRIGTICNTSYDAIKRVLLLSQILMWLNTAAKKSGMLF